MAIPLFEIKLSKKHIAIIKTGDRQLAFIKINKFDVKYFATKEFGVFELDDSRGAPLTFDAAAPSTSA